MAVSKAQQRAVHKYVKDNYDRMELTVPKGRKAEIKAIAESRGQSVNAFVNEAIDAALTGSVAQPDGDTVLTPKALTEARTAAEAAGEQVEAVNRIVLEIVCAGRPTPLLAPIQIMG